MTARRTEAYARYEAGTVHWGECDAVERDPARMEGVWRFTGTAVALADLFHGLAGGINTRDFVKQHEGVAENGPRSVLEFIADQLDDAKDAIWEHGGPREATPPRLKGGACNRGRDDDPQTTHWKECGNASRDSERMTGSWCLEEQRFPLSTLFVNLANAGSVEGLVDVFTLTRNEVLPVLRFLAAELGKPSNAGQPPADGERRGEPEDRANEAKAPRATDRTSPAAAGIHPRGTPGTPPRTPSPHVGTPGVIPAVARFVQALGLRAISPVDTPHAELSGGALPDWVVWYLAAPLGTSVQSGSAGSSSALLSKALAVPVNRITEILHGQRGVTAGHGVTAGAVLRDDAAVVAPAADLRAAAGRDRGGLPHPRERPAAGYRGVGKL